MPPSAWTLLWQYTLVQEPKVVLPALALVLPVCVLLYFAVVRRGSLVLKLQSTCRFEWPRVPMPLDGPWQPVQATWAALDQLPACFRWLPVAGGLAEVARWQVPQAMAAPPTVVQFGCVSVPAEFG